jgi:hypothetical protein
MLSRVPIFSLVEAQRKVWDVQEHIPPFISNFSARGRGDPPSPRLRRGRREILEARWETLQLEGALQTREEALEWVKREYSLG